MKTRFAVAAALLLSAPAASQPVELPPVRYPDLPVRANDAAGFVPAGWTLLSRRQGDLNGDGTADLVLLLRMNDPANVVSVRFGDESRPFDTNPHLLLVAFAERGGGYRRAATSRGLFPRPTMPWSGETPPGGDTIRIERGGLLVFFEYTRGWDSYRFRWQNGSFRLIGFDKGGNAGGCIETLSINYLTGRARVTKVLQTSDRERVAWRRLRSREPLTLERVDRENFFPESTITGPPLLCPEPEDD